MAKGIDEATIGKIRELAAEGKTFNQIANELGVGWQTVRRYARGDGKKLARGGKVARKKAAAASNGTGRYAAIVSQLREERDRLDRVIAELEQL